MEKNKNPVQFRILMRIICSKQANILNYHNSVDDNQCRHSNKQKHYRWTYNMNDSELTEYTWPANGPRLTVNHSLFTIKYDDDYGQTNISIIIISSFQIIKFSFRLRRNKRTVHWEWQIPTEWISCARCAHTMIQSKHHHQASKQQCVWRMFTSNHHHCHWDFNGEKERKKLVNAECCVIVVVQKKTAKFFFSVSFPSWSQVLSAKCNGKRAWGSHELNFFSLPLPTLFSKNWKI